MSDDFQSLADKFVSRGSAPKEALPARVSPAGEINPTEFFLRATLEGVLEPFGVENSEYVKRGKAEYPLAGLAADVGGFLVPYAGVSKIGKLEKVAEMLDKIGDFEKSPVLTQAKRSVALYAPLEFSKVASNAALNPDGLSDAVSSAAFNLGIESVAGGISGLFKAGGKLKKGLPLPKEIDLAEPPQVQLRTLKGMVEGGKVTGDQLTAAQHHIGKIEEAIRFEELAQGGKYSYVGELGEGSAKDLGRLFNSRSPEKGLSRKRLVESSRDFATPAERDVVMVKSGLKGNLDAAQYPRFLSFSDTKSARGIEKSLTNLVKMKSVGDGDLWTKEKGGLFVVARKIHGRIGKGDKSDQWVLFKTDDPGRFLKDKADWAQGLVERTAWLREKPRVVDPLKPHPVWDEITSLKGEIPVRNFSLAQTGKVANAADTVLTKLGLKVPDQSSELAHRLKSLVGEYFTPAQFEFKGNARAKWIHSIARAAYGKANTISHAISFGKQIEKSDSPIKAFWKSSFKTDQGSIKGILDKVPDEQLDDIIKATELQLEGKSLDEAFKKGEIRPEAYQAHKELTELNNSLFSLVQSTQEAAGVKVVKSRAGHLGLPRTWEGSWRQPLTDSGGRIVHVAAGKQKGVLESRTAKVVEELGKQGYTLTPFGKPRIYTADEDIGLASQVLVGSPEYMTAAGVLSKLRHDAARPQSFKRRAGVGGYKGDFTREELLSRMAAHTNRYYRYMSELALNKEFEGELAKLALEDPQLFTQLSRRLESLAGRPGKISAMQDAVVDKVLAPYLGANSASKIVSSVNKAAFHLQFGFLNLGFPIINALTFVQTVIPKVAFHASATLESVARHSDYFPVDALDGRTRGGMGVVSMFRLMKNSFRELRSPSPEALSDINRAIDEAVIDPRFIEESLGQTSERVKGIREILSGKDGYSKLLDAATAANTFLPGFSEKFARGHSFVTGRMVGKDFWGLEGDQLYRFAKEFTEQTMYNYGTADRARIMTGPLGSLFGLFKNWQTHYIANMLEYAGEGYYRGNWSPFLWQIGGTASLGGVGALPFYNVADHFSHWASNKSVLMNLYEGFGGEDQSLAADGLFMGLPSFLGLSLQTNVAQPFNDPARDASMLFSFPQLDRGAAIGQFAGKAIDAWGVTGQHPIDSPEVRDAFIQAFAPRTIARAQSVTEDQAIRSLNTGNKIVGGVNLAEQLLYTFGITPKEINLAHRVNEELWQDQKKLSERVSAYGKAWNEAQDAKDWGALQDLKMKAVVEGIPLDRIIRSSLTRQKNQDKPQYEKLGNREKVLQFKSLGLIPSE